MKCAGVRQRVLSPHSARWVKTFSKRCVAFLHPWSAPRRPRRVTPRGLTPLPPMGLSRASMSTFSMLVESDVLTGSRGILP